MSHPRGNLTPPRRSGTARQLYDTEAHDQQVGSSYSLTLHPSSALTLALVYRAARVADHHHVINFMPRTTAFHSGASAAAVTVAARGLKPLLDVAPTRVAFDKQVVIRSNQSKRPYTKDLLLSNLDDNEVSIYFGKLDREFRQVFEVWP